MVSIHVPLAEHDTYRDLLETDTRSFNSRAPRGARLVFDAEYRDEWSFNSRAPRGARPSDCPGAGLPAPFQFTCPSRSTTKPRTEPPRPPSVSIHVPLAEHDHRRPHRQRLPQRFNSRAPRGARRTKASYYIDRLIVSIHVPLAEHDGVGSHYGLCDHVSIHVPLAEHDAFCFWGERDGVVSIHVPLAEHDSELPHSRVDLTQSFQFTCPSRSTTSSP